MLFVFMTEHIHMVMNPQLFKDVPEVFLWFRILLQFVLILWAYWHTRPISIYPVPSTIAP
ncbi:MAG TPA: hypothetical protein PLN21_19225 [Gemmatales bacterium]|nr:hypothetical protein [Gemmatales bacterium]